LVVFVIVVELLTNNKNKSMAVGGETSQMVKRQFMHNKIYAFV